MHVFRCIIKIIVLLGALDLGVLGLTEYDVIGHVFGTMPGHMMVYTMGARVAFVVIGIAALLCLLCWGNKCCSKNGNGGGKDKGGSCCR